MTISGRLPDECSMTLLWPGFFVLAVGLANPVWAAERQDCSLETQVRRLQAAHA